jgi:cytochrome P450
MTTSQQALQDPLFDPFGTSSTADPYPAFKVLRDEHPVYRVTARDVWVISRHDDIQAISRDWRTFTNSPSVDLDDTMDIVGPGSFVDQEPPHHDELRAVLRDRFTPAAVNRETPAVEAIVERLLDGLDPGDVDLAGQIAWPLPVAMLCHLMGFPPEDVAGLTPLFVALSAREPGRQNAPQASRDAATALSDYVSEQMKERKRRPGDDLLSLIQAATKEGTVAQEEVRGMCLLLCNAGTSTTAALLGNAFAALGNHPDQRRILAEDPERIPAGLEEVLRWDAPVVYLGRRVARSAELHGVELPEGARLALLYSAANRDDRRYERPDVFDVTREPKRHLGFGEGIHFCLGAPLARLEARIMIAALLRRHPDYALTGEAERSTEHTARGFFKLPADLTGAHA